MTRLADAVDATLARLSKAAAANGARLTLEPAAILHRDPLPSFGKPGLWSTNRSSQMIAAQDGWLAVSLARDNDRDSVPAWTGCALDADPWAALIAYAKVRPAKTVLAGAIDLHLPAAIVGETMPTAHQPLSHSARRIGQLKALDLSALWAGPLCGGFLAQAGVAVTRIESAHRPDPTAASSPTFDDWLNGRKTRRTLALDDPEITDLIAQTDILITSARPHALARKGLTEQRLMALNPGLIWVAITAHGWRGECARRVGFGDDCAAAGGLTGRQGAAPRFMGDALADPLTGLDAAAQVLEALDQGKAGLVDTSLAQTAAFYANLLGLR
jgi:CoA-transferase family III